MNRIQVKKWVGNDFRLGQRKMSGFWLQRVMPFIEMRRGEEKQVGQMAFHSWKEMTLGQPVGHI